MKKLPAAVRTKAIQIANALLKEKKKLKESVIIATAIKKAKQLAGKSKPKKPVAKKKTVAKKTMVTAKAKAKKPAKGKTTTAAKKTTTKKVTGRKKVTARTIHKPAVIAKAKTKRPVSKKIKVAERKPAKPVAASSSQEAESRKQAPGKGGMHPVSTWDSHLIQNGIQHMQDVAYKQEYQKMQQALSRRRNAKRTYRMFGQR